MTPVAAAAAVGGGMIVIAVLLGAIAGTQDSDRAVPAQVPGIPSIVLDAYIRAAAAAPQVAPRARGMRWSILAGIGKIESNHLAGQHIDSDGTVRPPYLGPRLDGSGVGGNTTPIYDTDDGRYDGDTAYDRAVGLMQFIPGTWDRGGYSGPGGDGRDGNGDGSADPNNVYDSALAAVVHLAGNRAVDFSDQAQLHAAIYSYNHADWYVRKVRAEIDRYDEYAAATDAGSYGSGSGRGAIAIRAALTQLGVPYSWGGGTPAGPSYGFAQGAGIKGFDCSSLVQHAWAKAGVRIPRVTYDQWRELPHIPAAQRQPGDLVFFAGGLGTLDNPGHVGLLIDRERMVEAPHTGSHVRIRPANRSDLVGYSRPAP
jgi:hypothetical protein